MVMIMAMDIMVTPIATSITVMGIPIDITMVIGMATVIGDEPTGQAHPFPSRGCVVI